VFHPHQILDRTVFVELEDIHTEPGCFVDTEHNLAIALLVGRCQLCGIVYMPLAVMPRHNDVTSPTVQPPRHYNNRFRGTYGRS
jgi:hypothetical protein